MGTAHEKINENGWSRKSINAETAPGDNKTLESSEVAIRVLNQSAVNYSDNYTCSS